MSIKLIAIDMDGTLLNSDHAVSQKVAESIRTAQAQGVEIILATGRPFSGMKPHIDALGIYNRGTYCISNNGALIQNFATGEVVYESLLTHEDYDRIEKLSRNFDVSMHVISEGALYTPNTAIGRYVVYESYLSNIPLIYRAPEDMESHRLYTKCLFSDVPEKLALVEAQIPEPFYEQYTVVKSAPFYLEFLHLDSSKGRALQRIANEFGLKKEEIMCIGDHQNDFSMFEVAGTKVAMGNAIELLKTHADFITTTNDQDGVAVAIERYL